MTAPEDNSGKGNSALYSSPGDSGRQWRKLSAPASVTADWVQDEITRLRAARVEMQRR